MSNDIPDLSWRPPVVELETSKGRLVIELNWESAPQTCRNFATLAKRGYYDNTPIHRIVANKIIQAGDPTGTGKGGDSIYGGYFYDEIDTDLKHNGPGVVAMANAGKNMNKSQFYITLGTLQCLDNKSTIFGKVINGLDILERIGKLKTDKYKFPLTSIKIEMAKVIDATAKTIEIDEQEKELEEETNTSYFSFS